MANFRIAFDKIVGGFEGFYDNDPKDNGGETLWGIARNADPNAPVWPLVDLYKKKFGFPLNMKDDPTLKNTAINYYKTKYWDSLLLDNVFNQQIATELFDISVNMGQGTAATMLQRTLNVLNRNGQDYPDVTVDAKVGSKTIAALNNHKTPKNILLCINSLQGEKYISICEKNATQERFMNGWIQRVQL
jgi:lysozyme family protein